MGIWVAFQYAHCYSFLHTCREYPNILQKTLWATNSKMDLARQRTKLHHLLRSRCMRQDVFIVFRFVQDHLIRWFIYVRFRILRWDIDKHWQNSVTYQSDNLRFHQTIEWPFVETLPWILVAIPHVSEYNREWRLLPSMNPPCSRTTFQSVSFHKGLQFSLLLLSPFKIGQASSVFQYLKQWLPIRIFGVQWPPNCGGLANLNHLVHNIVLTFVVLHQDGIHQTPHHRILCLCSMIFHHHIILSIVRCTWKQPHSLLMPRKWWMESWCCCDLKHESNSKIHGDWPACTDVHLLPMRVIKIPQTPRTV